MDSAALLTNLPAPEPGPEPEPQPEAADLDLEARDQPPALRVGSSRPGVDGAGLRELLGQARLDKYYDGLRGLGVDLLEDLQHIESDDLRGIGFRPVEIKRLRKAVGAEVDFRSSMLMMPGAVPVKGGLADGSNFEPRASGFGVAPLAEAQSSSRSNSQRGLAAEVVSGWLALALVAAAVMYASTLLLAAAAAFTCLDVAECSVATPWPFLYEGELGYCENGQVAQTVKPLIENLIASSPGWMRTTLLTAVGVRAFAWLFGFHGPKKNQSFGQRGGEVKVRQNSAENTRASSSMRVSKTGKLLESILQDEQFSGRSDEIAAAMESRKHERHLAEQHLIQREAQHKRELQLTGVGGLVRMLLTGHGLRPVPRLKAGWVAITDDASAQSTWHEARESLGLTVQQAVGVSVTKLLLWHWSQPVAFLSVFFVYYCQLDRKEVIFGLVVTAREVLYLATTLAGILVCPAYLLLDMSTVWDEAESKMSAYWHLAMYILTPHNYVALCLTVNFSERGAVQNLRHRKKMASFGICTCCMTILVIWLAYARTTNRWSLAAAAGCWLLLFGPFLFLAVRRNAQLRRTVHAPEIGTEIELDELGQKTDQLTERKQRRKQGTRGMLAHTFLVLAVVQILADFSSCFALGALLQQWNVDPHLVPTAMIWGYTITAFGFVFLFGPTTVVASFRRAAAPGGTLKRVAAACFGAAMLLGLISVVVGAVILWAGGYLFALDCSIKSMAPLPMNTSRVCDGDIFVDGGGLRVKSGVVCAIRCDLGFRSGMQPDAGNLVSGKTQYDKVQASGEYGCFDKAVRELVGFIPVDSHLTSVAQSSVAKTVLVAD